MAQANPRQQAAINATDGPVLIIAGPGSGKTFTLVERIVNLIVNHGATAQSLFVVTFTEKAARELTTRVSNRLLEEGIYIGTLLVVNRQRNDALLPAFQESCWLTLSEQAVIKQT